MPTDITQFFKARCKTLVQKRLKEQLGHEDEKKLLSEGPSISYRKHSLAARKYATDILEFGHVVIAKRRDYLDFNALMATMSSSDRDRFDQDSERCLRSLSQLVLQLLEMISKDRTLSEQEKEHLKAVCSLLEKDIKKIGRVVTEMRRLRLTAMASRKEMSKLSSMLAVKQRLLRPISPSLESTSSGSPRAQIRRRNVPIDDEDEPLLGRKQQENQVALNEHHQQQQEDTYEPELDLSPAEMDQLQKENDKLFKKFTSAQDTVNSLETQIFEIQRLQECFSDKVFDQEKEIDVINEMAVGTTESLKDANEFIRQAISNTASRRVIILFCIVILTLTLLFLDWYNL